MMLDPHIEKVQKHIHAAKQILEPYANQEFAGINRAADMLNDALISLAAAGYGLKALKGGVK